MKMQNEIKSPIDGVVTKVLAQSGQTVDKNALLIVIEPLED
jgi:biotin carboxyl carrier protein